MMQKSDLKSAYAQLWQPSFLRIEQQMPPNIYVASSNQLDTFLEKKCI